MRTLLFAALFAIAVSKPPNIVHIVADDLGYNDLGHFNGKKTYTPTIDNMIENGILLTDYYTYKVCAPTRASIMTGRYPWGVGYFDMVGGPQAPDSSYVLLPGLLKPHGYRTHMIGKWDVGFMLPQLTPTHRGFDTYQGYYEAALSDYWYHTSRWCHKVAHKEIFDLSNSSVADGIHGWQGVNGTYDADIFTQAAVEHIHQDSKNGDPFYVYLAYMNVHGAATYSQAPPDMAGSMQAPCSTIHQHYNKTTLDTYKTMGGMLTELDSGISKVVQALKDSNEFDNTIFVFMSDNGGPLPHSTNHPWRGGKHTFWEGGLRVVSFIYSASDALIPPHLRGKPWRGLFHSSDWYRTISEGMLGLTIPNETGPRVPDSINLWGDIMAGNQSSRNIVIHQIAPPVMTAYHNENVSAIRMNNLKMLVGRQIGDNRTIAWPELNTTDIPFGLSGGKREGNTDHCRAPDIGNGKGAACVPGCIFDLENDPHENNNLWNEPKMQGHKHRMLHIIETAVRGVNVAWAWPCSPAVMHSMQEVMCNRAAKSAEGPFMQPTRVTCDIEALGPEN